MVSFMVARAEQTADTAASATIETTYTSTVSTTGVATSTNDGNIATPIIIDDEIPTLPTIYLSTISGEDPGWKVADKPDEDLWGESVSNNDPVAGRMAFTWPERQTRVTTMELRVRGNTSSASGGKQSYGLTLDQPMDMLHLGSDYMAEDWVLLNTGTSMRNHIGQFLAERCGMEWVTHGIYVNLVLNGDWKGLYYL